MENNNYRNLAGNGSGWFPQLYNQEISATTFGWKTSSLVSTGQIVSDLLTDQEAHSVHLDHLLQELGDAGPWLGD